MGYPVVLEGQPQRQLAHKSDIGGVHLGLSDVITVRAAFARHAGESRPARPPGCAGHHPADEVSDGVELLVGVLV